MRSHLLTLCLVSLSSRLAAQISGAPPANQPAIESVQKAAVRALNFNQGDAASLKRARAGFTPAGWNDFIKQMQGFIDAKGAPAFNSNFVPSGKAVVISEEAAIHLRIPGTLTQTQGGSRTTYNHCEIDVKAGGKPAKIEHLEPIYGARDAAR